MVIKSTPKFSYQKILCLIAYYYDYYYNDSYYYSYVYSSTAYVLYVPLMMHYVHVVVFKYNCVKYDISKELTRILINSTISLSLPKRNAIKPT